MGHSSHATISIYLHCDSNNHPLVDIFHFRVIDQDSKQVMKEAREALHIRINKPALDNNTGKMHILEIITRLEE